MPHARFQFRGQSCANQSIPYRDKYIAIWNIVKHWIRLFLMGLRRSSTNQSSTPSIETNYVGFISADGNGILQLPRRPRAVPLCSLQSAILRKQPLWALHPLTRTWSAPAARRNVRSPSSDYGQRHDVLMRGSGSGRCRDGDEVQSGLRSSSGLRRSTTRTARRLQQDQPGH